MGAPHLKRGSDLRKRRFERSGETSRSLIEGRFAFCRKTDQLGSRLFLLEDSIGRSFDDQMGVGPADPKRADAGDPPLRPGRPGGRVRRYDDRDLVPGDVWARCLEVKVSWDFTVMDRQRSLDEAGDPCS